MCPRRVIVPPMASMNPFATHRPSPTPGVASRSPSRWNGANTRVRLLRQAPPVVDDAQLDLVAVRAGPDRDLGLVGRDLAVAVHIDRSARPEPAVPQRVVDDVRDHPFQQPEIGEHRRQVLVHVDRHRRAARRPRTAPGPRPRRSRPGGAPARTAPVASREESSRLSTRPVSRSADSSTVASSSAVSSSDSGRSCVAQAADRGLDRRQRRAQVVAHRGQQRGAQFGGLRPCAARPAVSSAIRCCRNASNACPAAASSTRWSLAGSVRPRSARWTSEVTGDVDVGLVRVVARLRSDAGDPFPLAVPAFQQRDRLEAEVLPHLLQQPGQRVRAGEHRARVGGEQRRLGARPRALLGQPAPPGRRPAPPSRATITIATSVITFSGSCTARL